jgi:dolichol-phosphate mannosyltransferase
MKTKISVIIPTKNEPYVGTLVERLRKIFRNSLEIIVIEKGRNLPKIKAKVIRQKTDGLGNAFFEAVKYTHGKIIANMDGDGSHSPEDLKKLLVAIKNADLVIGSKLVRRGINEDLFYRQIITQIATKIYSFIMGIKVKDSTSGFFAVRKKVLDKIKIKKVLGYKILFPLAFFAQQQKFRIKEVPIVFHQRKAGTSHVSIFKTSGIRELWNEFKMAVLLRFGLY